MVDLRSRGIADLTQTKFKHDSGPKKGAWLIDEGQCGGGGFQLSDSVKDVVISLVDLKSWRSESPRTADMTAGLISR